MFHFKSSFSGAQRQNHVRDSEAEHWLSITAGPPLHRLLRQSQYQGSHAHVVTWLLDTCQAPVLLRLNCLHEPVTPPAAAPWCRQFSPAVSLVPQQKAIKQESLQQLLSECPLFQTLVRLYLEMCVLKTMCTALFYLHKNAI